jgi:hypothetical protein
MIGNRCQIWTKKPQTKLIPSVKTRGFIIMMIKLSNMLEDLEWLGNEMEHTEVG